MAWGDGTGRDRDRGRPRRPNEAGLADPESIDLPAPVRIGVGKAPGRGLRMGAALVVVALGLALLKPWGWGAPTTVGPQASGALAGPASAEAHAPGTAEPAAPTTQEPDGPWAGLGEVVCVSERSWMAVVDAVEDSTASRSWTRLALAAAGGPADPSVATTRAWADAVPRLGFCAPRRDGRPTPFDVLAWRAEIPADGGGGAEGAGEVTAVPLALHLVAGGTVADRGALYAPPAASPDTGFRRDPEAAWAADEGRPRPAGWRADGSGGDVGAGWPPGRYVFRVRLRGASPQASDEAWFAIEVRGPWRGVAAESAGPAGGPSEPATSGAPSAAPSAAPSPSAGGSSPPAGGSTPGAGGSTPGAGGSSPP